jgi:hypothetical protein
VFWFYVVVFCLFAMITQKSVGLDELDAKVAIHPDEKLGAVTIRHHHLLGVEI